mmetsp:Transcript_2110/g.5081  ORF Transcript_2110/g.5081 Transcript_2110/m.5081 type:complete len:270 (-) Transcript_2110:29-838(-)
MAAPFFQSLQARVDAVGSLLCVGLDPHVAELDEPSASGCERFCRKLIDATEHIAAAYKPNAAFFERFGAEGCAVLEKVCKELAAKGIPVVLDAKRGDIGSTAEAYAAAAFDANQAGCVTVSPYLGGDSVAPFLTKPDKAVFALCKTSNPGSNDLQTVKTEGGQPFYMLVATHCNSWGAANKNVGLVVGATDIEALRSIRKEFPDIWFLSPGIGAQGGSLDEAMEAGMTAQGSGMLIPISRGISKAADPKAAAEQFRDAIQKNMQARKGS